MTVHSGGHPDLLNPGVRTVQFPMGDETEIGAWSAGHVVGIGTRLDFLGIGEAIGVAVRVGIGRFLQLVQRRHLRRGQRPVVDVNVVDGAIPFSVASHCTVPDADGNVGIRVLIGREQAGLGIFQDSIHVQHAFPAGRIIAKGRLMPLAIGSIRTVKQIGFGRAMANSHSNLLNVVSNVEHEILIIPRWCFPFGNYRSIYIRGMLGFPL